MGEKVSVEITSRGPVTLVVFKAATISNTEEVAAASRQINEFVEEKHPKAVVIDFELVKFFSSQLLGVLLEVRAKLKAYDGKVVISAINPQLYRVFKITNLDKIFDFFADKDSAVKTFRTS